MITLEDVKNLLDRLTEKERYVIEMRFCLTGKKSMTLQEVGEKLQLTRERIRQIQNIALRKIKSEYDKS